MDRALPLFLVTTPQGIEVRDRPFFRRQCADTVKSPNLKPFFEQKAARCREAVTQLQQIVREMGGDSGTHRAGTEYGGFSDIHNLNDEVIVLRREL